MSLCLFNGQPQGSWLKLRYIPLKEKANFRGEAVETDTEQNIMAKNLPGSDCQELVTPIVLCI